MSSTVIILIFIKFKLVRFLLNRIVSEMHKEIVDIFGVLTRCLIFLGCKTSEPLLVDIYTKGVHSVYESVNSEVKLQTVY
jgi:hypothetical protein